MTKTPSCRYRSQQKLTAEGYLVGIVETWIPGTKITKDLFGMFDLLAIKGGETLAVQVTSKSNLASRVTKVTNHDNLAAVRKAGWRIEAHGWDGDSVRIIDLS
jgi:hypothetical protein